MMDKPEVLIDAEKIHERVREMGMEITEHYRGRELNVVCVLRGAIPFTADLIRYIDIPFKLDAIYASSYVGRESSGKVDITVEPRLEFTGENVLIVDDILDTGNTLSKLIDTFSKKNPMEVKSCVLLDKPSRRTIDITADYIGFEIPDHFVVGYGLDCDEYYRNLPYIGIMKDED